MSILLAFIIFDLLIIIYEILVEFFSTLYELSGIPKEQARFQVASLLTGTGFTTSESEKMLATKRRKKVTRNIMIISYIFNISIISTLITIFTSTRSASIDELVIGLLLSIIVLLMLIFSKKIRKINNVIDKLFVYIIGKTFYKIQNPVIIYDYYNDKRVLAEIKLNKIPKKLKNVELSSLNLQEKFNMKILLIKRKNNIIDNINSNTKLYRKDVVIFISPKNIINTIFKEI